MIKPEDARRKLRRLAKQSSTESEVSREESQNPEILTENGQDQRSKSEEEDDKMEVEVIKVVVANKPADTSEKDVINAITKYVSIIFGQK